MKCLALSSLFASSLLLTAPALAEIETSFSWVQGDIGSNFAILHADLDLDTGAMSVSADYQGLVGDLVQVVVRDGSGQLLGNLQHDGGREGLVFGIIQLSPSQVEGALSDFIEYEFRTEAFPLGEMETFASFSGFDFINLTLDAQQLANGGAPGAVGDCWLTMGTDGAVSFIGGTNLTSDPITAVELHTGAWFGDEGTLALDLTPLNTSANPASFQVQLDPAQLTDAHRADLIDGFGYLVIRSQDYPGGALRGQTFARLQYSRYCMPRSNSMSAIGAQLDAMGTPRVVDNNFTLQGQFFPDGAFLLPLVGTGSEHDFRPAGSRGILCIGGGSIGRFNGAITQGQGLDMFNIPLDLNSGWPIPGGVVLGQELRFQAWYRDTENGVPTSNFSSAISLRLR